MRVNTYFYNKVSSSYHMRGLPLLTIYLLVLSLFITTNTEASSPAKIIAITSGTSPVYDQVIEQLNKSLEATCADKPIACLKVDHVIRVLHNAEELASLTSTASPDLVITLGSRAAKKIAASSISPPTLYTLLPESTFNSLPNCCEPHKVSSIFLNQPLERQIHLIKAALPQHKRLGIIYGPSSRHAASHIKELAAKAGLLLESEVVENRAEVGAALRRLLKRIDVLLALPDPEVYSKQTVFNVLLSSYHNSVPVIGFSKGYVKAGALLALYSTPEQIGHHLADVVQQYFASGQQQLPPPHYSTDFSVLTNKSVARSFKITLPTENALRNSLLDKQE